MVFFRDRLMNLAGRPKTIVRGFIVAALLGLGVANDSTAAIVGVSIPVNSMDGVCHPSDSGIWSESAPPYPLSIASGIGYIVNPNSVTDEFSLHDHQYVASNVPDPTQAA